MQEKLQHCRQRLQYLVQRVASLPPNSHSLDEDDEVRAWGLHPCGGLWGPAQGSPRWPIPSCPPSWEDGGGPREELWSSSAPSGTGCCGVSPTGRHGGGAPLGLEHPLSPSAVNPECLSQAFVKVRNLLEKTMAEDPQNLKISLEDTEGRRAQRGHVPQRLSQPLPMGSSERPTVPADPDPGVASRPWG